MITKDEQDAILALARFGALCLREHRENMSDLDGGWIQETAIACGALEAREVKEPCGEGCECPSFPTECLFMPRAVSKLASRLMMEPRALQRELAAATALPASIQEALNSGDGSYRP